MISLCQYRIGKILYIHSCYNSESERKRKIFFHLYTTFLSTSGNILNMKSQYSLSLGHISHILDAEKYLGFSNLSNIHYYHQSYYYLNELSTYVKLIWKFLVFCKVRYAVILLINSVSSEVSSHCHFSKYLDGHLIFIKTLYILYDPWFKDFPKIRFFLIRRYCKRCITGVL